MTKDVKEMYDMYPYKTYAFKFKGEVKGHIGLNADSVLTFISKDLYGTISCTDTGAVGNISDLIGDISIGNAAFLGAKISTCPLHPLFIAIGNKNVMVYAQGISKFSLTSFDFDEIEDVTGKVYLP